MSSRPATIRSAVDFPHPDGPDEDHELAVGDVEVHVLDGFEAVRVTLGDVLELDLGHVSETPFRLSLDRTRCQPRHDPPLE